ncbi:PHB depolymerase family esterase [Sphingomonas sp. KR1UV-12]|uniref:PHB depolymerase family esterase n=1 Tax=Sphingomonas aurea TaxID=3063994 RepID=A0ABT9ELL1_9SPHN|nr:PHB depolymerase family esterase [Sphingomonas sp. KR1UV-12]MDP1027839.1 PHB depolymerase family esterase [Sphingomonas sp. KR1UV-12]
MRRLSDTLQRLAKARTAMPIMPPVSGADRLHDLTGFGSNPGALRARIHVPNTLAAKPALVVVLHGCTQSAAGYDAGSGWSRLADQHGFVVLFAEQVRANNPNLCFNWFQPEDIHRDGGEAESIRQMTEAAIRAHGIDRARVFVTGLSAGGAMTAVMLATCPELFAGGAIIAGLPYGSATSVVQALDRMRGAGVVDPRTLAGTVRAASRYAGPWPTVSVWHGSGDTTVDPSNAAATLAQWQALHGLDARAAEVDTVDGAQHRLWRDAAGRAVIEEYRIAGMGHGTPLDPQGSDGAEVAGAHMLDAGISSTRHIAAFWGLTEAVAPRTRRPAKDAEPARTVTAPSGPAQVIEDALRAAGLMR